MMEGSFFPMGAKHLNLEIFHALLVLIIQTLLYQTPLDFPNKHLECHHKHNTV